MELELSRPASFWQLCVPAFEGGGNRAAEAQLLSPAAEGEGDGWWCAVGDTEPRGTTLALKELTSGAVMSGQSPIKDF